MSKRKQLLPISLGIEAGGTRTVAMAVESLAPAERVAGRLETGPANLRLINDDQLARHFREIARSMPLPASLGIGMAGARTQADRERIRQAAARVWPGVSCYATNDLETGLEAAQGETQNARAQILVLSGTGSCCFGRTLEGTTAKVGGWGHVLGDKGSGYEIGLRALKAVVYYYDCDGVWSSLGQRILRALQFNEPEELVGWVQSAGKQDIAALTPEVFAAAAKRGKIALDILAGAAASLARDAAACAKRLVKPGTPVQFVLAGSVLLRQPAFAKQVSRRLQQLWPKAAITRLLRESVWGAVELARREFEKSKVQGPMPNVQCPMPNDQREETKNREGGITQSLLRSPTEQRNPLSMDLDRLPLGRAIELMLREDEKIPGILLGQKKKIEQALNFVVRAFRRGGRLFYVGAGTSGRLGVLDASECPPTFCTPPEMVQAIIAGGQRAIWEAVEGAEDDSAAGEQAARNRGVTRHDVVIGIAASGRTPFVWGALMEARSRGATTVLLCFNPNVEIPYLRRPHLVIAPNVGPEILTGSTRLKAGTATKLVLNIITTLAMVRLGKVRSNLMIDVKASNTKLRDRATRIVQELTGADYAVARAALEKASWKISQACENLIH